MREPGPSRRARPTGAVAADEAVAVAGGRPGDRGPSLGRGGGPAGAPDVVRVAGGRPAARSGGRATRTAGTAAPADRGTAAVCRHPLGRHEAAARPAPRPAAPGGDAPAGPRGGLRRTGPDRADDTASGCPGPAGRRGPVPSPGPPWSRLTGQAGRRVRPGRTVPARPPGAGPGGTGGRTGTGVRPGSRPAGRGRRSRGNGGPGWNGGAGWNGGPGGDGGPGRGGRRPGGSGAAERAEWDRRSRLSRRPATPPDRRPVPCASTDSRGRR